MDKMWVINEKNSKRIRPDQSYIDSIFIARKQKEKEEKDKKKRISIGPILMGGTSGSSIEIGPSPRKSSKKDTGSIEASPRRNSGSHELQTSPRQISPRIDLQVSPRQKERKPSNKRNSGSHELQTSPRQISPRIDSHVSPRQKDEKQSHIVSTNLQQTTTQDL